MLVAFNDAGKVLVDGYTGIVGRFWGQMAQKQLSLKGKLLIGFVLLELTRVVVVGITKLL